MPGEVVVVIGASGSGKSTLIRCINGLEEFQSGSLDVDMVFQQFNLFPHLSVLDNVTLAPMKVRGWSRQDAEETAKRLLDRVGIADQANKYPSQLSGGQQQRVALARALAMEPRLMLFDEPTSALPTKWALPVRWPTASSLFIKAKLPNKALPSSCLMLLNTNVLSRSWHGY